MLNEDFHSGDIHLSDEELLQAADGELPAPYAAQVRSHLSACWGCRARMAEIEATIADFVRAYRRALDPQLTSTAGPRAILRAQIAQLATQPKASSWRQFVHFAPAVRIAATICAVVLLAALVGKILVPGLPLHREESVLAVERGSVPDRTLTPGVTRRVSISDVCSMAHEDVVRTVPTSVRQAVFREYGILNAHASDYEIDYLIAPGLGGTEDVHNLWPEPYTSRIWNAHTKDALEEHLHEMVCSGKLELPTAQRDIATDWISAYKKYFHTDKPAFRS